ncbi:MAG: adenylyltransferase/cytidyltransferase family protein [Rikenellaceae bacterium]|nr:adenylyltransferase/cytidyltransferase family protein [Rikenellaceae bacterium]
MKIFHGFDDLPRFENAVVTVGSYDGVHAGHSTLLRQAVQIAREHKGESVVITFAPHPREVLSDGADKVRLLTTLDEKAMLLERAGVQNLVVAPFTIELSRLSAREFVERYLLGRMGMRTLVAGYNHHLGRAKGGDPQSLARMAEELDFCICTMPRHDVSGAEKVSSTVIRNMISAGNVAAAAKYLGYRYFLMGRAEGDGRFLLDDRVKLLPPPGVYPVEGGTFTILSDGELRLDSPVAEGKTNVTFV